MLIYKCNCWFKHLVKHFSNLIILDKCSTNLKKAKIRFVYCWTLWTLHFCLLCSIVVHPPLVSFFTWIKLLTEIGKPWSPQSSQMNSQTLAEKDFVTRFDPWAEQERSLDLIGTLTSGIRSTETESLSEGTFCASNQYLSVNMEQQLHRTEGIIQKAVSGFKSRDNKPSLEPQQYPSEDAQIIALAMTEWIIQESVLQFMDYKELSEPSPDFSGQSLDDLIKETVQNIDKSGDRSSAIDTCCSFLF